MSRSTTAVTGIGVIAPSGIGADEHWKSLLTARTGLAPITRFDPASYPVRIAGEVDEFRAQERVPGRLIPQTDRWTHFGLAAAEMALSDAQIEPSQLPEYEMAVVTASSSGGTEFGQHEMERLYQNGPTWVGAYQSIAWFYAATTGQVSIRHGMRGPCGVLCTEQAGGLDVLGQSRRLLATGSRLVVSGGVDSALCPYGLVAQLATGFLSQARDPAAAYLPFAADAAGYAPGEGGAILIVEDAATAHRRGRVPYGYLAGYAAGFDPAPGSPRPPALARVIRAALAEAELTPAEIDVVFADASAVPAQDQAEASAITEVFGPYAVPVTAPKTFTGRLYAGGAALDVATALLALRDGVLPGFTGADRPAPGIRLDLVTEPRTVGAKAALVLARGYGGFTSALVLTSADTDSSTVRK